MQEILLSLMIFVPLLGMIVVLLLPRESEELIKRFTLLFTLIPLVLAVVLFLSYDRSTAGTQYFVSVPWIETFNINYHIGIDGLSVTLLLLTALLGPHLLCLPLGAILKRVLRHIWRCSCCLKQGC